MDGSPSPRFLSCLLIAPGGMETRHLVRALHGGGLAVLEREPGEAALRMAESGEFDLVCRGIDGDGVSGLVDVARLAACGRPVVAVFEAALPELVAAVRRGALLHDIGKMGIPDAILLKPGPLTEEEWAIMRRHPSYAYELLAPIPYLRPALDIPHYHHERWDGTGYPHGLKGEAIPLVARIFAVVDVWDALRSRRPYREPWPEERVRAHIRSLAGSHFDPKVVEAFLALEPEALAPVPAGR